MAARQRDARIPCGAARVACDKLAQRDLSLRVTTIPALNSSSSNCLAGFWDLRRLWTPYRSGMTSGVTPEVELQSFLPQPHSLNYFEHQDHKNMGIVGLTVDIPSSRRPDTRTDRKHSPPRWKTVEFRCYATIACIVIPIMFWIPMTLSSCMFLSYLTKPSCR